MQGSEMHLCMPLGRKECCVKCSKLEGDYNDSGVSVVLVSLPAFVMHFCGEEAQHV